MNKEKSMSSKSRNFVTGNALLGAFVLAVLSVAATHLQAQTASNPTSSHSAQSGFASPQEAATALIKAAADFDLPELKTILGPEGEELVSTADPVRDKNQATAFAARAQEKNSVAIDPKKSGHATLLIGEEEYPLPVPLIKKGAKWYFDSKAGRDEILYRRIGANELDTINICRGFVEAQEEYASEIHDDSGVNQYAQRIISTPGKHDGLAWRNPDGTPGGPVGEAVAKAMEEGYTNKSEPYHGYYFKVLKGQGPAATLGQLDYLIEGAMIGGFALVAWPAEYRVTGVMTFVVSYDGVVFQKDLGPHSLNIVKKMERYNPD